MFDISAIIINYNSQTYTKDCIESIVAKTSSLLKFEIIVVDNCSEIADYLELKKYCDSSTFPHLKLVRSIINTGFGGGNMTGVQHATGNFLAFVNNDTQFINDCFSILKNAIENDKSIGIVGGQSFTKNGKRMKSFDHFASLKRQLLGRDFLEQINSKVYPKRKLEYNAPLKVNYVQGSFMFVKSEDFYNIGGFDTNIFLYYEESDLSMRLAKMGKSCYLIPEAQYIHHHGVSTPKTNEIKTELKISLLYVIRKHYGYVDYLILLNYFRILFFFKMILKPKYYYQFKIFLLGAPLYKSLKNKQVITPTY